MSDLIYLLSLEELKEQLGLESLETADDLLLRLLNTASRLAERYTGRYFYPRIETRVFDIPEDPGDFVRLDKDLISATSITDGGGAVDLNTIQYGTPNLPSSRYLWRTWNYWWYTDSAKGRRQAISITGRWGYSEETTQVATLAAAITSTTATSMNVSATSGLGRGPRVLIDSEALNVLSYPNPTVTISRGCAGTTAATHLINTPVYRYLPPAELVEAVVMIVSFWWTQRDPGYGIRRETIGDYEVWFFENQPLPMPAQPLLDLYKVRPYT